MTLPLGLGGVTPGLRGRGRVRGLGGLGAEPKPQLFTVITERASYCVGPGHPVVAAPAGVDHVLGGSQDKRKTPSPQLGQRLGPTIAQGGNWPAFAPDSRAMA